MSAKLRIDGIDELRAALRALPETLAAKAQAIIDQKAHATKAQIQAGYPKKSGQLAAGVEAISGRGGRLWAGALVVNNTWYAQIVESGSVNGPRETGNFENRGLMPANHTFGDTMGRNRQELYRELAAMMEAEGLTVVNV